MSFEDENDTADEIPLHHHRPFGSGLYRKAIAFVPAASGDLKFTDGGARPTGETIADLYLNTVLSKSKDLQTVNPRGAAICEICKLPVGETSGANQATDDRNPPYPAKRLHDASLVHQVCLTHSHPPSSIDRSRMGLSVLESQGWNPDTRQGLGRDGQGIQFPIKSKPKDNTVGLGLVIPKDADLVKKEKPKLLDAKKIRKMAREDQRKKDKLREQFFGNPDVEKYLGG